MSESLKEKIRQFPKCESCDIFLKTRELSNRALICETARACGKCPKDTWFDDIVALLDEAFNKCAYIDFEGNPCLHCLECEFYHGIKNGCSWKGEKKDAKP